MPQTSPIMCGEVLSQHCFASAAGKLGHLLMAQQNASKASLCTSLSRQSCCVSSVCVSQITWKLTHSEAFDNPTLPARGADAQGPHAHPRGEHGRPQHACGVCSTGIPMAAVVPGQRSLQPKGHLTPRLRMSGYCMIGSVQSSMLCLSGVQAVWCTCDLMSSRVTVFMKHAGEQLCVSHIVAGIRPGPGVRVALSHVVWLGPLSVQAHADRLLVSSQSQLHPA